MAHAQQWHRRSKHALKSVVSALLILGPSGCSTGLPFDGAISTRPSPVLKLSWAKAKRTSQGVVVWGQIQQVHCCTYVRGHIHVAAKDENGLNLAAADVPWGEFNPRQIHSAWFKAELPVPIDKRVSIDIQFSTELNGQSGGM